MAVVMAALAPAVVDAASLVPTIGLPITRNYALDDIGDVSRSFHLGFDPWGRLAVFGGDTYVVLNDGTWLDLAAKETDTPTMNEVVTAATGDSYFGSLATWGVIGFTDKGELRPRSLRPAHVPEWVAATEFVHVLPLEAGVYFAGFNGVVYWERSTGEQTFFHVPGATNIFALRSRVFVSSHSQGIQYLDLEKRAVATVVAGEASEIAVVHAVGLSDGRCLIATFMGRLLVFDGRELTPWGGSLGSAPTERVLGMQRLSDGGIAVAINGRGLFILSENGETRLALTSPEYQRVHDLAAQEPGVLWVATEGVVQKLIYGSPVTIVDRRLGVSVGWPLVAEWNGRTVIASSGRLYESVPATADRSSHFKPVATLPENGAWAMAAKGSRMLIGNDHGVFTREGDSFAQVLSNLNVSRLVMVSPDLCYALATAEITALRWGDGQWSEFTARVPGVGFPAVVHAAGSSVWIELGANRVARVSLAGDVLETRVINEFPWSKLRWVNIGVVGSTVMLSGGRDGALFFDEDTGRFCDAPELRRLLASAPFPIARLIEDGSGTLWASHEKGVSVLRANAPAVTIVREYQPIVQIAGDNDIWISTQNTLYHVNGASWEDAAEPLQPLLVSVTDRRTGTELYTAADPLRRLTRLPYAQNNLAFRFFSQSYAAMRPLVYEFTMSGGPSEWTTRGTDSLLVLHDLKEGAYRLTARIVDSAGPSPEPVVVDFVIAPPWHRAPLAYVGYGIVGLLGGCGLFFGVIRHTRRRNAFLENLVRERTEELRSTMVRLNEETHNAATLAERNRLAGEIHDSLQQGLSGLMLQLDATLKLAELTPDLRSRLTVARNMVSFTRHEVQQAVWDLESPLLENADLAEALKKMAALISAGTPQVEIKTHGASTAVPSSTTHQLLRIAQEAITNAVRHGHARKIFVHLEYGEAEVSLEIFDDGCGFVPQEVFASGLGHFGLRGLRGRASKINADLQIISAPNRGTTVRIVIPLARDPSSAHVTLASI